MKDSILERLKAVIAEKSNSASDFSKKIGIAQTTLSNQMKSPRGISIDVIMLTLEHFPDISAEWLLRGKGSMLDEFSEDKIPKTNIDQSQYIDFEKVMNQTKEEIKYLKEQILDLKDKIKEQKGCIEWQKVFISDLVVENHELEKKIPDEAK